MSSGSFFLFNLTPNFDNQEKGWELAQDTLVSEGEFTPELYDFLSDGRIFLNEGDFHKWVRGRRFGGQRHAEAMLRDQKKIPPGWEICKLFFPETVWRDHPGGGDIPESNCFPCMVHHQGYGWHISYFWGVDFPLYSMIVRVR